MTVVDQAEMLEVLLAYSATWQALTNTSTAAGAQNYIHQEECDDDKPYPRATVIEDERISEGVSVSQFAGNGRLWLVIDLVPDVTLETREARRDYVRDKVQTIISEMQDLSYGRTTPSGYSVSHLIVRRFRRGRPREESQINRPTDEARCSDKPQFVWRTETEVEYGS